MLAWIQRLLVLALLAATALWLGWAIDHEVPLPLAMAVALALLLAHAWVLALEFALLSRVDPGAGLPRPDAAALLRAWWGEVWTGARVFGWRQPFRHRRHPDHLPRQGAMAARRGVLLVHGFVCNRGLWNPWLARLRQLGVPYAAVTLEPVFGSIDDYTPRLAEAHAKLVALGGPPPLVVAHSMGGLAVRAWLARQPPAQPVEVITIGTPHHGTWLARFGRTPNARQMRRHSPWLRELAAREAPGHARRYTCFYGHCDNIVFPAETATLAGADNRHLPGTAHVHLAFHPEVFAEVLRRLGLQP